MRAFGKCTKCGHQFGPGTKCQWCGGGISNVDSLNPLWSGIGSLFGNKNETDTREDDAPSGTSKKKKSQKKSSWWKIIFWPFYLIWWPIKFILWPVRWLFFGLLLGGAFNKKEE